MQVPEIVKGPSLIRLLQGAAIGAVATTFVGFSWGGWMLSSTAEKVAGLRSEEAVVAALAGLRGEILESTRRGRQEDGIEGS